MNQDFVTWAKLNDDFGVSIFFNGGEINAAIYLALLDAGETFNFENIFHIAAPRVRTGSHLAPAPQAEITPGYRSILF